MSPTIDFRVAELMFSRLCHDLISPVTAINNGMELMADEPGEVDEDIRGLLTMSAGIASAKLQFYRIAYGLGGQSAQPIGFSEAGRLAQNIADEGKIQLDWPDDGSTTGNDLTREQTKLPLNLVVLGFETLPRGGVVKVSVNQHSATELVIRASGAGARLKEESATAILPDPDFDALTARSVQGYFVSYLARQLGTVAEVDVPDTDTLTLKVALPR